MTQQAEGLAVRLRTLFVAPGALAGAEPAARPVTRPASVAVLAPAVDAPWIGAAVGLALVRAGEAPFALVCTWCPETPASRPWAAPASRACRRTAAALAGRGHAAVAARRLVRLVLDGDEGLAAAEAARAWGVVPDAPMVLAVGGPRGEALDDLVRRQDHVMICSPPGAPARLAEVARAGLRDLAPETVSEHVLAAAPGGRALALAGVGVSPGLGLGAGFAAVVRAVA